MLATVKERRHYVSTWIRYDTDV